MNPMIIIGGIVLAMGFIDEAMHAKNEREHKAKSEAAKKKADEKSSIEKKAEALAKKIVDTQPVKKAAKKVKTNDETGDED